MAHGHGHTLDLSHETTRVEGASGTAFRWLILGVIGMAVGVFFGMRDGWEIFFRSYLLNFSFVLSLALGALFWVMLQHLTRAGWSVSLRRIAEHIMATLPLLAIAAIPLIIPVLTGMKDVYKWSSPAAVHGDPLLEHKAGWLNAPFFIIRLAFYFVCWILLARYFLKTSLKQDETGDPQLSLKMDKASTGGMLLYGLTVTFFAFDALMSLNPHWYSTIFGVYYFAGAVVGFYALLALTTMWVQSAGALRRAISTEHFHDVGKLAFGFVVFWAYIAFSQYMLIWYANIPEETLWYKPRQDDPWWIGVSLVLLFGHFVAPFLGLISRWPKRRKPFLAFACVWLLAMHWLDIYYIVIPRPHPLPQPDSPLHVSDLALLAGLLGLFVFAVLRNLGSTAIIPQRDPRLHESLAFENI